MADIKIDGYEYTKMQRRIAKLDALEAGGVDNWEYYGEALTEWRKAGAFVEAVDNAVSAVNDLMSEARVDQPAGDGAGYRIEFDEDEMAQIFRNFWAKAQDVGSP